MEETIRVAFDGDCLMCSRGMRYLAGHDPRRRFRFITLQSPRGQAMEVQAGTGPLKTMLVEADGRIYSRSAAALRCMRALGGAWPFLAWLGRHMPGRDALYDWIARHRHWFTGGRDNCSLPSPALLERLEDGDRV